MPADSFLLTEVSILSQCDLEPRTGPDYLLKFARNLSIHHALVIDVRRADPRGVSRDAKDMYLDFLCRIHDIAQADVTRPDAEKIDYIRIKDVKGELTDGAGAVCGDVWQLLDGLKLVYLEIDCPLSGFTMAYMDGLQTKWPLKTLVLSMMAADDADLRSSYLETVETLILVGVASRVQFQNATASVLQHLVIWDDYDNACDTFVLLQERGLLACLRTAEIGVPEHNFEGDDAIAFFPALRACHLTEFTFYISDVPDWRLSEDDLLDNFLGLADLPRFLPPTLETLRLGMLDYQKADTSVWAECVRDPAWLPRLKTFRYDIQFAERAPATLAVELNNILDTFAAIRPWVAMLPFPREMWFEPD